MIEYEYSFKVDKLEPYIKYCLELGFEKVEESSQIRTLYRNENKILARITTKETNGVSVTNIDFKDEDDSEKLLKVSRETIPLEIDNKNKYSIMSILDILGYFKHKELNRKRIVYEKGNIIFEIDDYTLPEIMHVIAIEGKKEEVDKIFLDISEKLGGNILSSN
jgi:adenylate cyclase class IV